MSAALDALIESPELARTLSNNARARHAEEFTWEHVAGQYEELLLRFLPTDKVRKRFRRGTLMIRVGVVGIGKMGISHLSILGAHPDVEIAGVCDKSSYALSVIGKYSGFPTYRLC